TSSTVRFVIPPVPCVPEIKRQKCRHHRLVLELASRGITYVVRCLDLTSLFHCRMTCQRSRSVDEIRLWGCVVAGQSQSSTWHSLVVTHAVVSHLRRSFEARIRRSTKAAVVRANSRQNHLSLLTIFRVRDKCRTSRITCARFNSRLFEEFYSLALSMFFDKRSCWLYSLCLSWEEFTSRRNGFIYDCLFRGLFFDSYSSSELSVKSTTLDSNSWIKCLVHCFEIYSDFVTLGLFCC
ncbi:hypothetical protein L9F63_018898, partial [Diploptera punctata]